MTIDLKAIEARCEAATPGPWIWERRSCDVSVFQPDAGGDLPLTVVFLEETATAGYAVDEDMDFIAAARTDLPARVALVREMRAVLEPLTWMLRAVEADSLPTILDEECSVWSVRGWSWLRMSDLRRAASVWEKVKE